MLPPNRFFPLLVLFCAILASGCANRRPPSYTVLELGPPDGYSSTHALSLNCTGRVVGYAETADGDTRAVAWSDGAPRLLETLGRSNSKAWSINNLGFIVGESFLKDGHTRHACRWTGAAAEDLDPDNLHNSAAYAVNVGGDAVGQADASPPAGAAFAMIFSGGKRTRLESPGWASSAAVGINTAGESAGWTLRDVYALRRAVTWSQGRMAEVPTPAGDRSWAAGLNDLGDVVGAWQPEAGDPGRGESYYDILPVHAFLCRQGKMIDLGTLGGRASEAAAVNAQDEVVGESESKSGVPHAFLWRDGEIYDLNDLAPRDCGWVLEKATGINDAGQICGYGKFRGAERAFLLNPAMDRRSR